MPLHVSVETRGIKRRFRLVCVCVCVCVCQVCLLCAFVSYLLCHVQVHLSGTRRPVIVGRQGRFGNENEMKRNEALACVRESACDGNSCRMTSVMLRQTNLAIESFMMCASKVPWPGLASEVTTLFFLIRE